MRQILVGRKKERQLLQRIYESEEAECVAIYGRRRVGKTFLVREFFKDKGIFFEITGEQNAPTANQLLNFHRLYSSLFEAEDGMKPPKDWSEAFWRLATICEKMQGKQKLVLFFDELPWLASPRSGFLSAMEYFWNRHASRISNLLMIVCGSSASWMINKIIRNRGGFHGRLSAQIRLLPFSLSESEEYLISRGINLPRKQIAELYMVVGGVPKYLSYVQRGQSATKAIDEICFHAQAPLLTEFHLLYASLFDDASKHVSIIKTLANASRRGLTQKELIKAIPSASSGGSWTGALEELQESGFIGAHVEFGKKRRDKRYIVIDEYSLFYLRWINENKSTILVNEADHYWSKRIRQGDWYAWAGRAFESICFKHLREIKKALSIGGVATQVSQWATRSATGGAQIDLLLDRADQCINLCELKFCEKPFTIDKSYAESLERKREIFRESTGTKKALMTTLITPYGLKSNQYGAMVVDESITLEQLF